MVNVAFRVNANFHSASGHLHRCLTLASGMKEIDPSCKIFFLMSRSEEYCDKITDAGHKYVDLGSIDAVYEDTEATLNAIKKHSLDILIVDNYSIDKDYLKELKQNVSLLVLIDDLNKLADYPVHVLVNNNIYAHTIDYNCDEDTVLLLGTEFVLLRSEFDEYQDFVRSNPDKAVRLLITFGGSDPEGLSVVTVQALKVITEQFKATIITGRSFQKGDELAREIGIDSRFMVVPDVSDMARRMAWADMALSSPSTTFYELLFMKVPSILIKQADNQAQILEYAARSGLSISLGEADSLELTVLTEQINSLIHDKPERDRICARIDDLVDGLGRFRLAQEIFDLYRSK